MKMIATFFTATALAAIFAAATARAQEGNAPTIAPVAVVSYDVEQTPLPGFGCWSHRYAGTFVDTGRVIGGSSCAGRVANYANGSGTLNDGIVSTSIFDTQLFTTRTTTDGQNIKPVITLHLGQPVRVSTLRIFGGNIGGNFIPGVLNAVTVEIGTVAKHIASIPVGPPGVFGVPIDDLLDISTTPLADIVTDRIVLRDFRASLFGSSFDQFSITEITVDGIAPVRRVDIDVKPGDGLSTLNPNAQGKVTVAILSTATFDAPAEVDVASVTFGRSGNEQSLAFCRGIEDVDGDGLQDLVCHFENEKTGFASGDTQGILKGQTFDGTSIVGTGAVLVR